MPPNVPQKTLYKAMEFSIDVRRPSDRCGGPGSARDVEITARELDPIIAVLPVDDEVTGFILVIIGVEGHVGT